MVSDSPFHSFDDSSLTPKFSNSFTTRIFSDIAGDITIVVDGESFLLHKFPLVARSGKMRKMVSEAKDSNISTLELVNIPGSSPAFELAMKFCYGINFEITTANVVPLRCAAHYLEMTDDYREHNLVSTTENYLTDVVFPDLEKSVQVLLTCDDQSTTSAFSPLAEEIGIPTRCIEAIAINVYESTTLTLYWIEDLSLLRIDFYQRVIRAMGRIGIRADIIVASLMHYAKKSLNGVVGGKRDHIWNDEERSKVEAIVSLMPAVAKSCNDIPSSFLFGMLRMATMVDANIACRLELERRIAFSLETVSLNDLFIPSVKAGDSLFDVDTVHRILVNFLERIDEEEEDQENEDCGYESEGLIGCSSHGSLLKVGRMIDSYLAEIAPDPYLSLPKFIAMIEILPDYARVIDDGLYRAIDIYLKAHPTLNEEECKKVCKLIDWQKLSQEASNHAAQNDRLPVQMTVRVLYYEQLRLKNAVCISTADDHQTTTQGFVSQKLGSSGVASAAMSPRDNYASLRRENRELKLEISRMRARLSELEKEQLKMKQGMILDKNRNYGTALLTSISKGIGRISIFGGPPPPASGRRQKTTARRSRTHSSVS